MRIGLDRERLHVDRGVFPDLCIDETPESEGERAFEQALLRQMIVPQDRAADRLVLGDTILGGPKRNRHLNTLHPDRAVTRRKRQRCRYDDPMTLP